MTRLKAYEGVAQVVGVKRTAMADRQDTFFVRVIAHTAGKGPEAIVFPIDEQNWTFS